LQLTTSLGPPKAVETDAGAVDHGLDAAGAVQEHR
jgi:hypothetical protein